MAKKLASEAIAEGINPGAIRTFCALGKYFDDVGLLQSEPAPVSAPAPAPASGAGSAAPSSPPGFAATPNAWLRGALFSAIQGKTRQFLREHKIQCLSG
ncbi:MAG: hypothetical protein ACKN9T_04885, partial [Candidatus Methylumidiphilus sp.]